ncbi:MAG: glycosyltransferase family 4 protein [Phycisphaerae bacterium]
MMFTQHLATFSTDDVLSPYIWVFYASFLTAFLFTPIMRRVATYYGVVDAPGGRKVHKLPTAYLGGVAVFVGFLLSLAISQLLPVHWSTELDSPLMRIWLGGQVVIPLTVAFAAICVVSLGLWDDIAGITPKIKILGQVFAAGLLLYAGIGTTLTEPFTVNFFERFSNYTGFIVPEALLHWVTLTTSCGLTIAIIVFCCNASNLMDGLDGLCGGVTAIIAVGLCILAVYIAKYPTLTPEFLQELSRFDAAHVNMAGVRVVIALALLGGVLGFVPYNFNPASIFMGDAGSLFLGFTCGLLIVLMGEVEAKWLLAALVMFSLPVLDTALAFARRYLAGRPVFSADKHHFHHQLIARGLSVKQAVLLAYGLAIFFVLCGLTIIMLRTRYAAAFYMVLFCSIIVAAYKIGMIHERVKVDGQDAAPGEGALEASNRVADARDEETLNELEETDAADGPPDAGRVRPSHASGEAGSATATSSV